MKRLLAAVMIATLMTGTMTTAHAMGKGPCSADRFEIRRYRQLSRTRASGVELTNRALIRCAFTWAGIPGQIDTAYAVADRESHFIPWAKNPWEVTACHPWSPNPYGACGSFQHLARYWPDRVRRYVKDWWFNQKHVPAVNERANALVTALMVRAGGWGPWGG